MERPCTMTYLPCSAYNHCFSCVVNTYYMTDGPSSPAYLVPWAPGSNLAARVNRAIDFRLEHTAGHHLLSVVQAATNTERL